MYKLLALGKDNKIHCCAVDNKGVSFCEASMPITQVNPDFTKLRELTWCYECSHLIELQFGE